MATTKPSLGNALSEAKSKVDATFGHAKVASVVTPCKAPTVETKLGSDVDAAIAICPAFAGKLNDLQAKGWTFKYGTAGKGSYCDRTSKTIVVDTNQKGKVASVVGTMAHEAGHAGYTPEPNVPAESGSPPKRLTRAEYAKQNANRSLKDEGEATIFNAEMKACLEKNGGAKISVAGAQAAKYEKTVAKYPKPEDRDKARQEIADLFADGEKPSTQPGVTYRQYYEKPYLDHYDKLYPPPKTPLKMP